MTNTEQTPPAAYFGSLTIENVKCFKGEHTIDLSDGNGNPAMWTVILGNNNTGKTTLLRCLADLEPIKKGFSPTTNFDFNKEEKYTPSNVFDFSDEWQPKISVKPFIKFDSITRIGCSWIFNKNVLSKHDWMFVTAASFTTFPSTKNKYIGSTIIYGYGTNRRKGDIYLSGKEQDNTASLFDDNVALTNIEEWLLQIYFAKILNKTNARTAEKIFQKVKEILICGILPDVQDFDFDTTDNFKGFAKFKTDYGWIKFGDLGYGYQNVTTLVVDLAKKLFERYPNSENPLHEPAIVLVDELDLHLHPEWQRKIISFLSKQFPKTQFIATTHSPLIVQSADNINLVILEKQDDHVIIKQPDIKTFKGWTVDEILTELMGLDDKTLSDDYLKLIKQFDDALDNDNYQQAKNAYDELDKILHPSSHQRKLLRIQMASLSRD